jgi:hypothetical protein
MAALGPRRAVAELGEHIKQVEVRPPGELGSGSTGRLELNTWVKAGWPGSSAAFTVTEFNPYHNWKWVAGFLWLTCHYRPSLRGAELDADQVHVGD